MSEPTDQDTIDDATTDALPECTAAIDASWAQWLTTLDTLTPDQRDAAGTCGPWSVRDLIAHVGVWDEVAAGKIRGIREGAERPTFTETIDDYNERTLREFDGVAVDDLVARMHDIHARLRAEVEDARRHTTGEARQWIVWAIAGDTWQHYDEHRQQIETRFSAAR